MNLPPHSKFNPSLKSKHLHIQSSNRILSKLADSSDLRSDLRFKPYTFKSRAPPRSDLRLVQFDATRRHFPLSYSKNGRERKRERMGSLYLSVIDYVLTN
ncbi:hypothetical protein HanPI659440_Chr01g0008751 [Helianthus annuus]|nr:hypothetical protein HanPI659440_Chr01g0008751 [Helianthus annuus]